MSEQDPDPVVEMDAVTAVADAMSPTGLTIEDRIEEAHELGGQVARLARDAAERLADTRYDEIVEPLAVLFRMLASHCEEGLLEGQLPYRVQRAAAAVLSMPLSADEELPPNDVPSVAIEHVLLTLNSDPNKPPHTSWYAEQSTLSNVVRGQGVMDRIELLRLTNDAAVRADLLDDFIDLPVEQPPEPPPFA